MNLNQKMANINNRLLALEAKVARGTPEEAKKADEELTAIMEDFKQIFTPEGLTKMFENKGLEMLEGLEDSNWQETFTNTINRLTDTLAKKINK